jgi:hypothetical protein
MHDLPFTIHDSRAMSIKLTIIFFILICFEIGVLLMILPWIPNPSWNENYLLVLAADKMHWPWLALAMKSGYARGAVSGLGLLNILLGVWEIIYFRRTARAFQMEWQSDESNATRLAPIDLHDHRSTAAAKPDSGTGSDTSN